MKPDMQSATLVLVIGLVIVWYVYAYLPNYP